MRRWWILIALLAVVGGSVGWVYAHPPLTSNGLTTSTPLENPDLFLVYGIDLRNDGRWPLTLTGVSVNGRAVEYPDSMGVTNPGGSHTAGNAAVMLEEYGHKLELGPVKGLRLEPHGKPGTRPAALYGIRLEWGKTIPPDKVILHYRYLGLPMRYTLTDRWNWK